MHPQLLSPFLFPFCKCHLLLLMHCKSFLLCSIIPSTTMDLNTPSRRHLARLVLYYSQINQLLVSPTFRQLSLQNNGSISHSQQPLSMTKEHKTKPNKNRVKQLTAPNRGNRGRNQLQSWRHYYTFILVCRYVCGPKLLEPSQIGNFSLM